MAQELSAEGYAPGLSQKVLRRLVEKGLVAQGVVDETAQEVEAEQKDFGDRARGAVQGEAGLPSPEATHPPESEPRLQRWKLNYDCWSKAMQASHLWAVVKDRLLTDVAEGTNKPLLTVAEGLVDGVFFGMDAQGNPLFADGKQDPKELLHCGYDYATTRALVRFEQDKEGNQVPTGYQMFPYVESYKKSPEILAFEAYTGKHFVEPRTRTDGGDKDWRASWVESGNNPSWPRTVNFFPSDGVAGVSSDNPENSFPVLGARRLLRGQKKA